MQGAAIPSFCLKNLKGEEVDNSSLVGAPALLTFFQSNCTWCHTELPKLADVYRRNKRVDVRVLGIAVGQETETVEEFAQEMGLDFELLTDDDGSFCGAMGLKRVPSIVFVDEGGEIARIFEGVTTQLAGIVEQTLLASAGERELPQYSLVGNGCTPNMTE